MILVIAMTLIPVNKTGTIAQGNPTVTDFVTVDGTANGKEITRLGESRRVISLTVLVEAQARLNQR